MYVIKSNLNYSKKKIAIFLFLIVLCSFGLKYITLDLATIPQNDVIGYALQGISLINGDLSQPPRKTLGWPIFSYPILSSNMNGEFFDLLNSLRLFSFSISIISIYPMYMLSRRFFNEKYSLVASFLFAIEPHLSHNAGLGLSEPIFILLIILTTYFVLSKNLKLVYLAFFLTGLVWWVRFNGIIMLPILIIVFFLTFRKTSKLIPKLLLGIVFFLIIASPMLIQRYEQFGDPFYFSQKDSFYRGNIVDIVAENTKNSSYSLFDYISEHGIFQFVIKFLITGLFNLLQQVIILSFPFLIFLVPIGMFFSVRAFDQDQKYTYVNWIVLLGNLVVFVTYFAVVQERRLLFHVIPFLIIFAVIPIQRLIEYGLSTFSLTQNQKMVSLLIVLFIVGILSIAFTARYEMPDVIENNEKVEFSKYVISNYNGTMLNVGDSLRMLKYVNYVEPFGDFRTYRANNNLNSDIYQDVKIISISAKSFKDLISIGEQYDLKYIVINNRDDLESSYPFLQKIYDADESHPYLTKVFDSKSVGYEKLEVKIFKINYLIFRENTH